MASRPTRIGERGLQLIKSFEGYRPKAYRDIAGVWTIGYGHTAGFKSKTFNPQSIITEAEAEDLLRRDLEFAEAAVRRYVKVPIRQGQFDALVSLVFNVGIGAFRKSTVLRELNRGNDYVAGDAFLMWNKATINGQLVEVTGLTRRRKAERALFLETPSGVTMDGEGPGAA